MDPVTNEESLHLMATIQEIPTVQVRTGTPSDGLDLFKMVKQGAGAGSQASGTRSTGRNQQRNQYFISVDYILSLEAIIEPEGNHFFAERDSCFL